MKYPLKALWRFTLYYLLRPLAVIDEYDHESVRRDYHEAISLPVFGCVAFRRSDGSLQFRW